MQIGGLQSSQVVTQRFAAHLYVDVFAGGTEVFDADQSFDALNEVTNVEKDR